MEIHPATDRDLEEWARLRTKLWPGLSLSESRHELPELIRSQSLYGFLARSEGRAAGFAEASIRPFANGCDSRPVAFLEGLWVEEDARRKGTARALVRAVEEWARARGLSELGSDALLSNRESHAFHLGSGFEETERVVYFRKRLD